MVGRITLEHDEHIRWSIMGKLASDHRGRRAIRHEWGSPEEKMRSLCAQAVGGTIIGMPAGQLLTIDPDAGLNENAGSRQQHLMCPLHASMHCMWIDIDCPDLALLERWIRRQGTFPPDACVITPSTTLNHHVWVATDVPLKERWQRGIRSLLRGTMPEELRGQPDLVLGPESSRVVFLPMLGGLTEGATAPRTLMRNVKGVFRLSNVVQSVEDALWL